jgi:single-strand DNA-binding protein
MNTTAKNAEQPKAAAPAYQNRVTLIGYLGRAPEPFEGHVVLSLATKTWWKPKGSDEWQTRTEWHRVVAWGQLAETVRAFAEGDHVVAEGSLRSSQYERQVQVTGGDIVTVTMKTFEVRATAIRKLAPTEIAPQPAIAAA